MPDGSLEVIKKDFSKEVKEIINETNLLVLKSITNLDNALQLLLTLEKQCRNNNDTLSLSNICIHIVRLCYQCNDITRVISSLILLHKRRTQSKYAIIAIVTEVLSYLNIHINPKVENNQLDSELLEKVDPLVHEITKLPKIPLTTNQIRELLQTLMSICDGKMYLEAESAKIHMALAQMSETEGDLVKACEYIQDVHVETFGSLSKIEKASYIIQQIRLNLKNKDYIRALLQSRKMNRKTIEEEDFLAVKIEFYTMQVEYHSFAKETWEICQSYYKLYEAYTKQNNSDLAMQSLESSIIYLILSPYDPSQQDMLHRLRINKETKIENGLLAYSLLNLFATNEIVPLNFATRGLLESHNSIHRYGEDIAQYYLKTQLDKRIVEHNIRVISRAYTRIYLARLAELLGLTTEVLEDSLSDIAHAGDITVKINRSEGIVSFEASRSSEEVLSEYGSDVSKLLRLMESTCHLIRRENMVYKI